jgi:hypothetical protein
MHNGSVELFLPMTESSWQVVQTIRHVICARAAGIIHLNLLIQTARIWDLKTGESKVELRGHENYLEVVVFAPVVSYQSIGELSGIELVRGSELLDFDCSVQTSSTVYSERGSGEISRAIHSDWFTRQVYKALGRSERPMH